MADFDWRVAADDLNKARPRLPRWLWEAGAYRILDHCASDLCSDDLVDPSDVAEADRILVARFEEVLALLGCPPVLPAKALREWVQKAKTGIQYIGEIAEQMRILDPATSFDWIDWVDAGY